MLRICSSRRRSLAMELVTDSAGAQRMRTARLAEAPHQNLVGGVEVDQGDIEALLEVGDDGRKLLQAAALADIHDDGGAFVVAGVFDELGKAGDQLGGKVVHAVVAHVLEDLERGDFARAAQSGDDHQPGFGRRALALRARERRSSQGCGKQLYVPVRAIGVI